MVQVTEHFSLGEFAQPARHGCEGAIYPEEWLPRLLELCKQLEIIRSSLGKPIRIISGYRSPGYNKKLPGAAKNSQHMQGRAADIVVDGMHADDVHDAILALHKLGKIQIGGLGRYPGFTHVDIRESKRLMRWTGSRTLAATE